MNVSRLLDFLFVFVVSFALAIFKILFCIRVKSITIRCDSAWAIKANGCINNQVWDFSMRISSHAESF